MNIEKLIEVHGFDVHGGCPGREPSIAVSASNLRVWQAAAEQISRSEIIDVLLATRGLSEGVTADAILAAMRRQNEI